MKTKSYCGISALLFSVVALAHMTRLINGWMLQVDDMAIPMPHAGFLVRDGRSGVPGSLGVSLVSSGPLISFIALCRILIAGVTGERLAEEPRE